MEKTPHYKNLLVELLVEELPPKALKTLGEAFADGVLNGLIKCHLKLRDPRGIQIFASPRRLGVIIPDVLTQAPDRTELIKLMPVSVGLDNGGNATPALLKRLGAFGADESIVIKLKKVMDGKAEALFLDQKIIGLKLVNGLQTALDETLAKLPIPKVMTYQLADGWTSVNFVRPAHGLVAMHGSSTLDISVLGLKSGNTTQGHRFEAKNAVITISHADSYEKQLLEEGAVITSFAARKAEIAKQLNAAAAKQNLKPIDDDALLDEVTALVERPNVLLGQFEKEFLEVPQECLILTMKANQKYFPLLDANNNLTNKFLIVSNISPADPSAVIQGNERVVRPRLADAKFFFDQDRKKTLGSRLQDLFKVVYHNKLGNQAERSIRVAEIAKAIGAKLGGNTLAKSAETAAALSKADLLTDMVGEFPELQGIMGRYYTQYEGKDKEIAYAIEDHYKPRFSGDELPRSKVGLCVSLADKLETLVGLFGIGEKPTGDKDPYALRRHSLGVIRILVEHKLPLEFGWLIKITLASFKDKPIQLSIFHPNGLLDSNSYGVFGLFVYERFGSMLRENGVSVQFIESVISLNPERFDLVSQRLDAVNEFSKLAQAATLAAANKRVSNILKKTDGTVSAEVRTNLLTEPAEIALNSALSIVKPEADKLFESGDYTASLKSLAALKMPVDDFFDNVMVNADDVDLKNNRLALLNQLHQTMNRVADLSKLAS